MTGSTRISKTVILAGGSVRAAAGSALRARLSPWCVDLFVDTDLRAVAPATRIPPADYPRRLPDYLRDAPPGPLVYTGGLENHPKLIERIGRDRPVWGSTPDALRRVRDPFFVAKLLEEAGLPFLPVSRKADLDGIMLRKPLRGAGGSDIGFVERGEAIPRGYYRQQFVHGPSFAAIFCAFADRVELLGVTRQLVSNEWRAGPRQGPESSLASSFAPAPDGGRLAGSLHDGMTSDLALLAMASLAGASGCHCSADRILAETLNAKPFQYAGSIGPIPITDPLRHTLLAIAETLRTACRLRGLFGIDYVLHGDQTWLVEVNPRYTASIEIIEQATGVAALAWHRAAFEGGPITSVPVSTAVHGKAILFASNRMAFPSLPSLADIADVPAAGEVIEAGWPILTVFSKGATEGACLVNLCHAASRFELLLAHHVKRP